jgi:hypothetical protein
MKIRIPQSAPSLLISCCALFVALGGTGYAAAYIATANNSKHLGGQPPSSFARSSQIASSHGETFLSAGQEAVLGKNGQFTFFATCKKEGSENVVSFDVVSSATADLDDSDSRRLGRQRQHHRKTAEVRRTRTGRERQRLDRDWRQRRRGGRLLQRRCQLACRQRFLGARLLRRIQRSHRPLGEHENSRR